MRKIFGPAGLDLAAVLPEDLRKCVDGARLFVHTLEIHRCRLKDKHRIGFINLKRAYFRNFFPDEKATTDTLLALRKAGVIECDETYTRGSKSLGYRIGARWQHARMTASAFDNDRITRKFTKAADRRRKSIKESHHLWLFDCLRRLKADPQAMEETDRRLSESSDEGHLYTWAWQRHIVDSIEDQNWLFELGKTGRITTGLTCLNKTLRRFLTLDGDHLVAVDVVNAHPLLIGLVCRNALKTNRSNQHTEMCFGPARARARTAPPPQPIRNRISEPTVLSEKIETSPDLDEYLNLCQTGQLYEALVERMGEPRRERQWVKKTLLASCFYGENHYEGPIIDLMTREFPSLMKEVRRVKLENQALIPKKRFKELSLRMLKLESEIVINRAVPKCQDAGVGWLATLHDSLICRPCDVPTVKAAMLSAFAEHGATPTLKVEPFGSPRPDAVDLPPDTFGYDDGADVP